ncbi:MAG: nucleoside hydrolase, partial [Planctomycetia bacterium]|nr:nucleoside hydrolase [Planctomycetia bacterium]
MPRKILIDGTPGVDEAIALSMAFFHPELEVVAVTSTGGRLPEGTAARNLRGLIEFLGPSKYPRIGAGSGPSPEHRELWRDSDFLEDAGLPEFDRLAPCTADRVMVEAVRSAPHEVTIITCGPLTNLFRAFQRDPELPSLIRRVVITGG